MHSVSCHACRRQRSEALRRAFARFNEEDVHGLVLLADPSLIDHAAKIADLRKSFSVPNSLPATRKRRGGRTVVLRGEFFRSIPSNGLYVDRMLKGADHPNSRSSGRTHSNS